MEECIFCKIVKGEIPSYKIYEDNKFLAFLDITPINPGHTLVISKEHYPNLLETPDNILSEILVVIKRIAPKILEAVNSKGFNLGLNTNEVSGQVVPHLHFHIMPRFENDGHKLFSGKDLPKEEMLKIQEKIKTLLK